MPAPTGDLLIGGRAVRGAGGPLSASDPATGMGLEPTFLAADLGQLDAACALAAASFELYRARPLNARAEFLETIADEILALGDDLVVRAMAETGLPRGRLEGERGRTVGQLRLFAEVVRLGDFLELRVDPALPARTPAPRPDLRLRHVPLGPVAVFGASAATPRRRPCSPPRQPGSSATRSYRVKYSGRPRWWCAAPTQTSWSGCWAPSRVS